jgi:hypothetical protein
MMTIEEISIILVNKPQVSLVQSGTPWGLSILVSKPHLGMISSPIKLSHGNIKDSNSKTIIFASLSLSGNC